MICALPDTVPVPDNIVAADIVPPNDVDVPAIVIDELANLVFVTAVSYTHLTLPTKRIV